MELHLMSTVYVSTEYHPVLSVWALREAVVPYQRTSPKLLPALCRPVPRWARPNNL